MAVPQESETNMEELEDGEICETQPRNSNVPNCHKERKVRELPRRYLLPDPVLTSNDKKSTSKLPISWQYSLAKRNRHVSKNYKILSKNICRQKNDTCRNTKFCKGSSREEKWVRRKADVEIVPVHRVNGSSFSRNQALKKDGDGNGKKRKSLESRFIFNEIQRSPSPQLDINSSYEELLKHHKSIQKELARLEEEDRKHKRPCLHNQNRKSSVINKSKDSCKKQPAAKKTSIKAKYLSNFKKKELSSSKSDTKLDDVEVIIIDEDNCDENDPELEQLRLMALSSCTTKVPLEGSDVSKELQTSEEIEVLDEGENGCISSSSMKCSSAFSVSGGIDNYSVLDMEESDDAMSCVSEPGLELPLQFPDDNDDDFEIDLLRAELINSLNRKQSDKEEQDEPVNSLNKKQSDKEEQDEPAGIVPCTDDENLNPKKESINSSSQSSELETISSLSSDNASTELTLQIAAAELVLQSCILAVDKVEPLPQHNVLMLENAPEVSLPKVNTNEQSLLKVNSVETQLAQHMDLNDSQNVGKVRTNYNDHCFSKLPVYHDKGNKQQQPWYTKQEPVIISLGDESSSSESETEDVSKGVSIASLEKLIESAKNDSKCQDAKYDVAGSSEVSSVMNSEAVTKTTTSPVTFEKLQESKNRMNKAAVETYKIIKKKLLLAIAMLEKEQQILSMTKAHANKRKAAFITSRLQVQRIKEQLGAAERVKLTNMRMMFHANSQLQAVERSISKQTALIKDLNAECFKLEVQFLKKS